MPTFRKLILASLVIIAIAALMLLRACLHMRTPTLPTPSPPPFRVSPSPTVTPTPTATATSTPTPTPTPTFTPLPDDRLARALAEALWVEDDDTAEQLLRETLSRTPSPYLRLLLARVLMREERFEDALPLLEAAATWVGRGVPPEVYIVLAEALRAAGRDPDALDAYRAYVNISPQPPLADIAYHEMALLQKEWGDLAAAEVSYRQALALARGDERFAWAWERARVLAELLRIEDALDVYASLLQPEVPLVWRAQAYLDRGRLFLVLGRKDDAYRDLRAVVELAAETDGGSRPAQVHRDLIPYAHRALVLLVNEGQPVDDYTRGVVDVEAGAYRPGYEALTRYLRHIHPHHGDAHAYLARALVALGHPRAAIPQWEAIIRSHPDCPCWGSAWFQLAGLYRQTGQTQRAVQTLRDLIQNPRASDELRVQARLTLADGWLNEGRLDAARSEYVRLAYEAPGTRAGTRAALVAAVLYLPKKPENAAAVLEQALAAAPHPTWHPPLRYWLGVAYALSGQTDKARSQWEQLVATRPNTVYTFRAAERLRALGEAIPPWTPPPPGEEMPSGSVLIPPEERLAPWLERNATSEEIATLLRRAAAYDAAGMEGEAVAAYSEVLRRLDDEHALIALGYLLQGSGYPQLGIRAALRALTSGGHTLADAPPAYWPLLFPTPARSYIMDVAREFDMDPALLYAIIRQESHFATAATSTVSARGLMQLMPGTARDAARGLGLAITQEEDIYRPLLNLRLGAYYFAFVFHRFQGNVPLALAAYNAGPGNAARWRDRYGEDRDRFTELVPLLETRTYIREVERQWFIYRALLGE